MRRKNCPRGPNSLRLEALAGGITYFGAQPGSPDRLVLQPAAQVSQSFPSRVARTLITGAGCLIAVHAAARAKSFAIWLAKRPGWQGQEHLFPEHVFKRKATVLIIPDFCLRRGNGVLRPLRVYPGGPKKEIVFALQRMLDRFNAARAGNLKFAAERALETNVSDDFPGPAMFVKNLGAADRRQVAELLGFLAEINRPGRQGDGEIDWLAFQIDDGK